MFTDDYMLSWDIYVGTETTADGYEVYTIQHEGDSPVISDNVYYYAPDPYTIFNAINEAGSWDKCIVYIEELNDIMSDLEDYMLQELETNYMNWLDETIVLSNSLAICVAFSFDFSISLTDISSSSIEETNLPILLAPAIITLLESEFLTPSVSSSELRFNDLTKKKI